MSLARQAERNAWQLLIVTRGELATLRMSETKTLDLQVVFTKPQPKAADANGAAWFESKGFDVLVTPGDLIDPTTGQPFELIRGMIWERENGERYRLLPRDSRELVWTWNSNFQTWIRSHTERE